MKLRRRLLAPSQTTLAVVQKEVDGVWLDQTPEELNAVGLSWLCAPAISATQLQQWHAAPAQPDRLALPCQPLSFRDGMLYEQHWVQSSRGYAKHFLPWTRPFTRSFEAITGQPFPAFRPGKLWHKQPIYYFGNHLTMVPSGTDVSIPSYTQALDYELELGWFLSKPLLNASPDEALAAIGGFVVVNDFSARDVQRAEMQTGLGPQKSKHFLSSMSTTLVTADEILPTLQKLNASVEVNGQIVAQTSTAGMRYHPGEVLAHLSRSEKLYPGELIASGTLPYGCGMETGHLLQSGDHVRLSIEGVGDISHCIR